MMDRIIAEVEGDPSYRSAIDASHTAPRAVVADAICLALRQTAGLLPVAAMVTYTRSGATSLRAARERPLVPVLSMTPELGTARRLVLTWGVHSVHAEDEVADVPDMVTQACAMTRREGFARAGDVIVIASGMPFGVAGTTNFLHIAKA
jgi:pyruvate kinase